MQSTIHHMAQKLTLSLGDFIHRLSQQHNKQTVINLTREHILTTDSSEIQKKGLDFLYMNGLLNDLQRLVEMNRESEQQSNRDWAHFYQLVLERSLNSYHPDRFIKQVNEIQTNEPELNFLKGLAKAAAYIDLRDFAKVEDVLTHLTVAIADIEDPYLQSNFNTRLYFYLFIYYWIRNELIIARKYAYKAFYKTSAPLIQARLNAHLGVSYLFESYEQGMFHLEKSLETAKKHYMTNLTYILEQLYIPFFCACFNKTEGLHSRLKCQQAHIELARGNNEKATELLRDVPMNNSFRLYYLGLATEDKHMLTKSYNSFIEKDSNYFFSRLPLQYLQ